MAKLSIVAGAQSQSIGVFIQNNSVTTGAGLNGLTAATANLTAYYTFGGANSGSNVISLVNVTGNVLSGAWTSGGFIEIDNVHMIGWYRLDLPNALLVTGKGRFVDIHIQGAPNMAPLPLEIELTGPDNQQVDFGLSGVALPTSPIANSWGEALYASDIQLGRINIAQAGSSTSITLDSGASADSTSYVGDGIYLYGGTGGGVRGAGQYRTILTYNGSTKVATVNRAWSTTPDNTTKFMTLPQTQANVALWQSNSNPAAAVATGVWQDATSGDFTVSSSIGKSLFTGITPGTANGLLIAGTNAATNFTSTVNGTAGLTCTGSGNANGFYGVGTGTGNGISGFSTGTGAGLGLTAAGYYGFYSKGANGFAGALIVGNGAAGGMTIAAGTVGPGLELVGGTTSGQALYAITTSGNTIELAPTGGNAITATGNISVSGTTTFTGVVTASAGIAANITGTLSTVTTVTNQLTAAQIATGIWTDVNAGDFAVTSSPGKIIVTQLGGSFISTSSSIFNAAALQFAPTGGSAPTTSQIATAVWTDLFSSSDFSVALSVGASLKASVPQSGDAFARIGSNGSGLTAVAPAATALALTTAVPTTGNTTNTVADALNGARAQAFGPWAIVGTTLTLYAADGITVVHSFTLNSSTSPTSRT